MPETRTLDQAAPLQRQGAAPVPIVPASALSADAPGWSEAVATIRAAIRHPGYFTLSGALGEASSYPAVLAQMRRFFALADDDARKREVRQPADGSANGWTPRFGEPAYQPGTLAHVESFDCGRPDGGETRPNLWPDIEAFRQSVEGTWDSLTNVGRNVMRAVAAALELERDFFVDRCRGDDLSTLRLLHYPALTEAERSAASVGISAHTDFECITLIAQTAPGLELLDADDRWRDADFGPDRLVVLLGDMLERWTNGLVRATGHRVRPQDRLRYSIVRFFAVDPDVRVEPLPQFVTADRPPGYASISQGEHTQAELDRAERYRDELAAAADDLR
ncbi:MAG: 2OG-Fe(II) oxygenase family protein [Woeseiaceae bacterium]|nr:2OG-Fe(II) oxygenase family protein [Woeseiaceae bacterium]